MHLSEKAKAQLTFADVTGPISQAQIEHANPITQPSARQARNFDSPQPCAKCGKPTKVPWLIVIITHASQPVEVRKCCASCSALVRYSPPAEQFACCSEIAQQAGGRRAA